MYKKHHCKAKIRYYPSIDTYVHVAEHTHPVPHILNHTERKLDESRRNELAEFIKRNTHIKSSKHIAEALNNTLTKEELHQANKIITTEDVQDMKKKFYSERITCLQDLYIRPDLAQTKSEDQFVRIVHGFPVFLIVYASNYQMNLLKSITHEDQIYVDGTFDFCPEGCEQMITIHIRKKGHEKAIPAMFIFLNKRDYETYLYMWSSISTLLIPELMKLDKLYVACDFELAMHKALRKFFTGVEIVGCHFHLLQAISRWIKKRLPKENQLKLDPSLKTEFKDELLDLSRKKYNSLEEFKYAKQVFLSKWRTVGGELFYHYLYKTWFSDQALFPPNTWALSLLTTSTRYDSLDQTNNQAEIFHHHLNGKFAERPQLKRAIQILQDIEHSITNDDITFKRRNLSSRLELDDETLAKKRSLSTFKLVSNENSKRRKLTYESTETTSNSNNSTTNLASLIQDDSQLESSQTINTQSTELALLPPQPQIIPSPQNNTSPSTQLVFESYNPNQSPPKKRGRKPKVVSQPNQQTSSTQQHTMNPPQYFPISQGQSFYPCMPLLPNINWQTPFPQFYPNIMPNPYSQQNNSI